MEAFRKDLNRGSKIGLKWLMVFSIRVSVSGLGFILAPVAMIEGLDMIWDQ